MRRANHAFYKLISLSLTVILVLGISLSPVFSLPVAAATETTYYVSVQNGNDANPGTLSNPFQTIQQAANQMNPGDICIIREGVYPETVRPKSGISGAPMTFKVYEGETATVSGCDPIVSPWVADGGGIYKTSATLALGPENQLFVDGEIMYEARYPNVQPGDTLTNFTMGTTKTGTGRSADKQTTYIADSNLATLAAGDASFFDGASVWMVPGSKWSSLSFFVEGFDPASGKLITPSPFRTLTRNYYTPGVGQNYFVYGSKKLLDQASEWWYDEQAEELYVMVNGNPNALYIEAKNRTKGFDLDGVSYIEILGIDTRGTTITTDKDSSHILLKDMKCLYVGHNSEVNLNDLLTDLCLEQDNQGVLLKGSFIEVNSCEIAFSSGPVLNMQGTDNTLINSYIHDGNYIGTFCGHTKLTGRRHLVSHNTLKESARDVISFRGLSESVIQYNEISDAGRLTEDLGIMYTANSDGQNTLIHHNVLRDNHCSANNSGLYPDEMSHNYIIYQNIIYGVKNNAITVNQPSIHTLVYNNTGYDKARYAGSYSYGSVGRDDIGRQVVNNIFYDTFNSGGTTFTKHKNNLTSGTAGVIYQNPTSKDFRLAAGSPAIGIGIPIAGVTDRNKATPSVGALEEGEAMFTVGHNFTTPPNFEQIKANIPSPTLFEYRNLVKNGGFEFGSLENWGVQGDVELLEESSWHSDVMKARSGFFAVQLGTSAVMEQTIAEVIPSTTYHMGINLRKAGSPEAEIVVNDQNGNQLTKQSLLSTDLNANWGAPSKRTLVFTTKLDTESLTISVRNIGSQDSFRVDDISLAKLQSDHQLEFNLTGSDGSTPSPANASLTAQINTNPKTMVTMDSFGKSPMALLSLTAQATWSYSIDCFGYDVFNGSQILKPNDPSTFLVGVTLTPRFQYSITFDLTPADATIRVINHLGNEVFPDAPNGLTFTLPEGTYTYEANHSDYEMATGKFLLTANVASYPIGLTAKPTYSVNFAVNPSAALVKVTHPQGQIMTPVSNTSYTLQAGTYSYSVSAEGYYPEHGSVTLPADTGTITINLRKIVIPPPTVNPSVQATPDPLHLDLFDNQSGSLSISLGQSGSGTVATRAEISLNDNILSLSSHQISQDDVVLLNTIKKGSAILSVQFFDVNENELSAFAYRLPVQVNDSTPLLPPEPPIDPPVDPVEPPAPNKSSASSSGGGRSTADVSPNQRKVSDQAQKTLSLSQAKSMFAEALKQKKKEETTIVLSLSNITKIPADVSAYLQAQAVKEALEISLDFTFSEQGRIVSTLTIPLSSVKTALNFTSMQRATAIRTFFGKYFKNNVIVIPLPQEALGSYSLRVTLLPEMVTDALHFYGYNAETNTYRLLPIRFTIENHVLTFETKESGTLIICENALAK